ncbi:MAG: hypothetical protein KA153_08975 [Hyphomonadaceae bacterium]|nr:hypothetical protein [Hyphomonadaceae bacterium]
MSKTDGRRDLSLIRASGSTARVLNLAAVFERFGETPEYAAKPLFRSKLLNRALIIKHAVRKAERDLFELPLRSTTKIILPYSTKELELGGVSVLVRERRWEKVLRQAANGDQDPAAFEADIELVRILSALPSFDPFLMRERLRHAGVEPARCYFDLAEADVSRMRAFVSKEIGQLIDLAFATGGRGSGDLSSRLAEKLMTDESAKSLDPLRQTLRLSGEDYVEGVFAWKGFLYYKWLMAEFRPQLATFKPQFEACRVTGVTTEERRELALIRQTILKMMEAATARVEDSLLEYGAAFAALASGDAGAFRNFLLKAPSLFIPIGEAVGVIRHIESFWRFRFPNGGMSLLEADEAMEVFHDFEISLSGVELLRDSGQTAAA